MAILDASLVAEIAGITTSVLQVIKSHPKIRGSFIPYLGGIIGVAIGVLWYIVSGDVIAKGAALGVDWQNIYRGLFNGVAGAVVAQGGYNIQKAIPLPNILPTSTEMDESKLKEEVRKHELVVEATQKGVDPKDAKKAVGLDPESDPPSVETLEQMQPPDEQIVEEQAAEAVADPKLEDYPKKGTIG
jgi:hypothetical protein